MLLTGVEEGVEAVLGVDVAPPLSPTQTLLTRLTRLTRLTELSRR